MRRKVLAALCLGLIVFVTPALWLRATTPVTAPGKAAPAEVALVYGAVVRDGAISPLHKERLDAGRALWQAGRVTRIVVSNTPHAAQAMRGYLLDAGVPDAVIDLDPRAEHTPDTCRTAATRPARRVIHVSQRFHLPRIALHCRGLGLTSQYVMADAADRVQAPLVTRLRVRGRRALRETVLIWGVLLGLYPETTTQE